MLFFNKPELTFFFLSKLGEFGRNKIEFMKPMYHRYFWVLLVLFPLLYSCNSSSEAKGNDPEWGKADSIIAEIHNPVFKDTVFLITDFGAVDDGETNCSKFINAAIDSCSASGGGTVLVPSGTFLTSFIHLKSNVNLHLDKGAELRFSTNPDDYLPVVLTRWEGIDCYNYSPLIYAYNQENIAVTGLGILNGQADETNWWKWKGRGDYGHQDGAPSQMDKQGVPLLREYENNKTPVDQRKFGQGGYLRPQFVNLVKCKNILLEDITLIHSPFWQIHPLLCENFIARRVSPNSTGPNNDGIDPESCKNVLIEDCYFNTGDDCIAIKSGRNYDGRRWNVPSENLVIRNCKMKNGHGGVVIGSEISGGCKNVFVENCDMDSPQLDRAIRIKSNSDRGGIIENIYVRNITVGEVNEAVVKINCLYDSGNLFNKNYPPTIRNVNIENITSAKSKYAVMILGLPDQSAVSHIKISNCKFNGVAEDNLIQNAEKPQLLDVYINNKQIH